MQSGYYSFNKPELELGQKFYDMSTNKIETYEGKGFMTSPNPILYDKITVYDSNGNIIKAYEGKFNVSFVNGNEITFIDEQGCNHIIRISSGAIIVEQNNNTGDDQ